MKLLAAASAFVLVWAVMGFFWNLHRDVNGDRLGNCSNDIIFASLFLTILVYTVLSVLERREK